MLIFAANLILTSFANFIEKEQQQNHYLDNLGSPSLLLRLETNFDSPSTSLMPKKSQTVNFFPIQFFLAIPT